MKLYTFFLTIGVAHAFLSPAVDRKVSFTSRNAVSTSSTDVDEYAVLLHKLDSLMRKNKAHIEEMKVLAEQLLEAKLADPSLERMKLPQDMKVALAEAKAGCDIYGPNSEECEVVWTQLEEFAETDDMDETVDKGVENEDHHYRYNAKAVSSQHAYNSAADSKSLKDLVDALIVVNHVTTLVEIEQKVLGKGDSGSLGDVF